MSDDSAKSRASQLRQFRKNVSLLKQKGLVSKRVDAHSQRQTKYMKSLVRKYADVLEGKASVVSVGRAASKSYSKSTFRPRFGKIVVSRKADEKVFFDKKSKQVYSKRIEYGQVIRKIILPQNTFDPSKLPKARKGKRIFYRVPFNGWTNSPRFDTLQDLVAFMQGYAKTFPEWQNYVEIEELDAADFGGDGDDDF